MESAAWIRSIASARHPALALGLVVALLTLLGAPQSVHATTAVLLLRQTSAAFDQADGTADLTIYLSLTNPTGQPATGSLSGYSFTLASQSGSSSQVLVTNQLGQVATSGLAPGIYSLTESAPSGSSFGSMTINGITAMQGQPFQLQAGGNYAVNVTNIVSGSGTASVQVQLVDQNGQPIPNASLSGFSFTFTSQQGASAAPTVVTSSASGLATASLTPGAYAISETAAAGASLINYVINGVPTSTGQFTVALGQTVSILANNRAATANVTGGNRAVALSTGCNNVASTFPDGTTGQAFASAIAPAGTVAAIWRFDNSAQTYQSVYFPANGTGAPQPVDITALNRFDALWVCVTGAATLNEPNP